jgi:hypothetical protein
LDPTAHDPLLRWLAWAHPVWMGVALSLVYVALRRGLALRRAGRERGARVAGHVRVARAAVTLVWIGLLGGLTSAIWLRG